MSASALPSLFAALGRLTDPRKRRGIRHPFTGVLALTFLGLLCRQTDFATIARWAKVHWDLLRGPLGFTRVYAPHPTTLSRVTARYSLAEFQDALCHWLSGFLRDCPPKTAAVDGKTSKQGYDADGDPIHVLNVFAHDLRVCSEVRTPTGERTRETRYFATSLDPGSVTASGLLATVRGHGQVENNLHFIKDRWWDEDRHDATRDGVTERFVVLLNAVLTVLVVTAKPDEERPLRARADEMGWLLYQTLEWFTGQEL